MLRVEGLRARYDEVPVLFGLDFEVRPGEAVALLGRNGMGKSSTLKALMGLIRFQARVLRWGEADLRALPAPRRARLGIGYVPQEGRIFPALSVQENLRLGGGRDPALLERLLETFAALRPRLRQPAGTLSGGEQQMLSLVRALWARPRLLLCDEPSEGLMPALVTRLQAELQAFVRAGGALLLTEQNVTWARSWCDRLLVLERGRLVFAGPPTALSEAQLRRHLGLGREPEPQLENGTAACYDGAEDGA